MQLPILFDWLTENSSIITSLAQIALSASLTIVTYFYWQETREQTTEMKRTREVEFRPVVRGTLREWTVSAWVVEITNTGKGAAYDVTIDFYFDDEKTLQWKTPQLAPGESTTIQPPIEAQGTGKQDLLEACKGTDGVLLIKSSCHSALDTQDTITEETEINIPSQIEKGKAPGVKEKDDEEEYYKERREIVRNEIRETLLGKIENHSEISVRELQRLTGFHPYYMESALLALEAIDMISLDPDPDDVGDIPPLPPMMTARAKMEE